MRTLQYVQFHAPDLLTTFRRKVSRAAGLSRAEANMYIADYIAGLEGYTYLEDGLDVQVAVGEFEPGDLVEIAAGTLMGLKGRVLKKEGKRKLQIELVSLGMSLLISLDAAFLEKYASL